MKILVIGGTGLISTPLVNALVLRGDEVTVYNRGKTTPPARVSQMVGDRTDYAQFEAQMREAKRFDCVIDMVGYSPADGESVVRTFAGQIENLVFCSTVDVYQKPASSYPVRETEPYGPLNDYGRGKVSIEKTLIKASQSGAFKLSILRPAHTYNDHGALIHAFGGGVWIDRLRRGLPIIVHGDGTSLWSQAHAEDVARAFVQAASNPKIHDKSYTVTNEECLNWNQLFTVAAEVMGAPTPQLIHIPTDVLSKWALEWSPWITDNFFGHNLFDISAAKVDLNYRTTIDFRLGTKRYFDSLEWNQIEAPNAKPLYNDLLKRWHRAINED